MKITFVFFKNLITELKKNFYIININFIIINWLVKEKNLFFGFFSPVSSRWKYLAKKYRSKKETNAREVSYAWKNASKLNTYKGFYIPSNKPKADLASFFFQKWEEDEKIFKEKNRSKKIWKFEKSKSYNFYLKKKLNLKKKLTKFYKLSFFLKKLFLKNYLFFWKNEIVKKNFEKDPLILFNFLKLNKSYTIFLKKKKIYKFKYKNFLNKNLSILNFNSKLDFEWLILNRGFNSVHFFNFFFFFKLPSYLASLNFNYIKILFLKNLKRFFKYKFFLFKNNFKKWFLSTILYSTTEWLSKFLNKNLLKVNFLYLNILYNWIKNYKKLNFFKNLIFYNFLNVNNTSILWIFLINILKFIFKWINFLNSFLKTSLSEKKKKLLINFLSNLVGCKTFIFWINKKWKKINYKTLFYNNLFLGELMKYNINFENFFFLSKNKLFLNKKLYNFNIIDLISKIFKSFFKILNLKTIFLSTNFSNFYINFDNSLKKKLLFFPNSNKNFEWFSNFYIKNIQNYKNITNLLSQSFTQQLDVYVNINLINMLFKFLIKWGKKLSARKVFIKFITQFKKKYKMPALAIFTHAVLRLEPKIWLKKKKIAGWIYEIPIFISSWWSKAIAIRWLLTYAKKWQKYNFSDSLSQEIWDACFNWGLSFNAKTVIHTTAKRNKSYMWWF